MSDKFYTKTSGLTKYSLQCGYIHRFENDKISSELYMEHEHYHVKMYDRKIRKVVKWNVYESNKLTDAKKDFYADLKPIMKKGRQSILNITCRK